jgi:hypothetical protein
MLRLKKEQSYDSFPLWAFLACSRVNFIFISHPRTHAHTTHTPLISAISQSSSHLIYPELQLPGKEVNRNLRVRGTGQLGKIHVGTLRVEEFISLAINNVINPLTPKYL